MKYDWCKQRVESAVQKANSYSEVLRILEIPVHGRNADTLKRKIEEYNLDTTHFTFRNKEGKNSYTKASQYLGTDKVITTYKLKLKLLEEGIKENKCERCGLTEWLGKPITCQLHHIDGNSSNNSLENLQMLCPNCHSQTENFCIGNTTIKKNYCKDCGAEITRQAMYCNACYNKHHHKIEKPSKEELINKYKELKTFSEVAKFYNVGQKTIPRWFIHYELPGKAKELKAVLGI